MSPIGDTKTKETASHPATNVPNWGKATDGRTGSHPIARRHRDRLHSDPFGVVDRHDGNPVDDGD